MPTNLPVSAVYADTDKLGLGNNIMCTALSDPQNTAALWSAVAASFAAIAAFLSWLSQIKALRHTFRPEVVLTNWRRLEGGDTKTDVIAFTSVKNVGRDTARQIIINAFALADDNRPTYTMSTLNIPSLAAGETVAVDSQIHLIWNNVATQKAGSKQLHMQVRAWYWDALNVRHVATLSLIVCKDTLDIWGAARLTEGVYIGSQVIRSVPVWRLKLWRLLALIPGIGKRFRDEA